jgi:hypothetical protein
MNLRTLAFLALLSLSAFVSLMFLTEIADEIFLVKLYVMAAEMVSPFSTPVLLTMLFVQIGPGGGRSKRWARGVCAIALYAILFYFAMTAAFAGNFAVYPSDLPTYAVLIALALASALIGFWPVRHSRAT